MPFDATQAGAIRVIRPAVPLVRPYRGVVGVERPLSTLMAAAARSPYETTLTGLWRILNEAGYWYRWNQLRPPLKTDAVNTTSSSLPHTPADTFTTGVIYLALTEYNGCLESEFFPVGPHGEPYLRIDLETGSQVTSPPAAPADTRLVVKAGGVIDVVSLYAELANRADEWAITVTTDGSVPGQDSPDYTQAMGTDTLEQLILPLDATLDAGSFPVADNTVVNVRVQTRRNDGSVGSPDWTYSETTPDDYVTATADALGPATPPGMVAYPGYKPKD